MFKFSKFPMLQVRVGLAYYKYGRFCSSHPIMTMLISIATLFFMSYPIARLDFQSDSSPLDLKIVASESWSARYLFRNKPTGFQSLRVPIWAQTNLPFIYVLQIFVRAQVSSATEGEFISLRGSRRGLKASLSSAFNLRDMIMNMTSLDNVCFKFSQSAPCVVLSPALLWNHSRLELFNDSDIFDTILTNDNASPVSRRHFAFGMSGRYVGLKRALWFPENGIRYGITLLLSNYDETFVSDLMERLNNTRQAWLDPLPATSTPSVALAYYNQRNRAWAEYIPLAGIYFVLFWYIYFSASKIDKVKSKWGLAFAACFTVFSSLVMAIGVCLQFDLTLTVYSGELFPYLALFLGMENSLCLTRSVVSIPAHYDVKKRIAYGLSHEGWQITVNFISAVALTLVGFFTFVPEIQEFCKFAIIGLFTDFYMQLFFFVPVLTFDSIRVSSDGSGVSDDGSSSSTDIGINLHGYPDIQCPIQKYLPGCVLKMFQLGQENDPKQFRHRVESTGVVVDSQDAAKSRQNLGHRRSTSSVVQVNVEQRSRQSSGVEVMPRRLRLLRFWTQTRFVQRLMKLFTLLWIVWIAVMVNQLKQFNDVASSTYAHTPTPSVDDVTGYVDGSNRVTSPFPTMTNEEWLKRSVRYWPSYFDSHNVSLSGRYLTILQPLFLGLRVDLSTVDDSVYGSSGQWSKEEPKNSVAGVEDAMRPTAEAEHQPMTVSHSADASDDRLRVQISMLELQMIFVLIVSISIFLIVIGFICFVCFYTGGTPSQDSHGSAKRLSGHNRIGSKTIIDSIPIKFQEAHMEIESASFSKSAYRLASSTINSVLLLHDADTGELVHEIRTPRKTNTVDIDADDGRSATLLRQRNASFNAPDADMVSEGRLDSSPDPLHAKLRSDSPSIWCISAEGPLVAVGYSDGGVELWDIVRGHLRGIHLPISPTGVKASTRDDLGAIHILLETSQIVVARSNGFIDFLGVSQLFPSSDGLTGLQNLPGAQFQMDLLINQLRSIFAHSQDHSINDLKSRPPFLVTASSDKTLKVMDSVRLCELYQLHYHTAAVVTVIVDEHSPTAFSSSSDGMVCAWDIATGQLMFHISDTDSLTSAVELACSSTLLTGVGQSSGCIWLWDRATGHLLTKVRSTISSGQMRLQPDEGVFCDYYCPVKVCLLDDSTLVVARQGVVQFWDLNCWCELRQVNLMSVMKSDADDDIFLPCISSLIATGDSVVLCVVGHLIYRITFPVLRLK